MRTTIIFILALLTNTAFGNPLEEVTRDHAVCLHANYTAKYMQEHPRQTVSDLKLTLSMQSDPADPTIYLAIKLNAQGKPYLANMICDKRADGGLHCAIECDGGQAEIHPSTVDSEKASFINLGFYIAGACGDSSTPIVLEPTAGGDDIFTVQSEPAANCAN